MVRTILDTAGIIVILFIAMVGYVPDVIPVLAKAWAEDPHRVLVFGAQVFTWVWGLLAVAIAFSRTAGPIIERRVIERIKAKQAQAHS